MHPLTRELCSPNARPSVRYLQSCLSVNSILETSSSENDTDADWQAGVTVLRLALDTDTAVRAPSVSLGCFYCSRVCDCRTRKAADPERTASGTGTLTVCTSSVHFLPVSLKLNSTFIHAERVQQQMLCFQLHFLPFR